MICPECKGKGTVWSRFRQYYYSSETELGLDYCRRCGGRGVIDVEEDEDDELIP